MYIFLHILKMQMNICLRDLPTRKKSRLPSRAPTHAYADCEISGQQPTQLYKEFPRVHAVGHSKKKRCSFVYSVKTDAFTSKGTDEVRAREVLDFNDDVGGLRVSKTDDRKLPTDDYKFVKNELIKIPVYESREIAVEDEYNTDNIVDKIVEKQVMIRGTVPGTGWLN